MDDTSYKGASLSAKELLSWRPLRHSADVELDGELSTLVARSRDLIRNNGIASGAIQTLVDNVVGNGLKLVSIPDHRILGLDLDYLEEWARKVESLWRIWSESVYCDAARKLNFNSQTALIFRSVIENGEALALVLWRENQANQFATCFQLIEPDRLSNPDFKQNTEFLRDGIEINHYGEPQNYWISKYYPNDYYYHGNTNSWEKVAAQTSFGRKLILHIHHPERIGQNRGKPLFTSIMPLFKMLDHYERSELKASVVNAMIAAFIETPMDRQRRRFDSVPSKITVKWFMNASQFSLFEAWYKYHAKEGAEWFVISLLGGLGLIEQEARFTQQFTARLQNGILWAITSELEIRERPTLSEGALNILLSNDFEKLSQSVNRLHEYVHITCPKTIKDL